MGSFFSTSEPTQVIRESDQDGLPDGLPLTLKLPYHKYIKHCLENNDSLNKFTLDKVSYQIPAYSDAPIGDEVHVNVSTLMSPIQIATFLTPLLPANPRSVRDIPQVLIADDSSFSDNMKSMVRSKDSRADVEILKNRRADVIRAANKLRSLSHLLKPAVVDNMVTLNKELTEGLAFIHLDQQTRLPGPSQGLTIGIEELARYWNFQENDIKELVSKCVRHITADGSHPNAMQQLKPNTLTEWVTEYTKHKHEGDAQLLATKIISAITLSRVLPKIVKVLTGTTRAEKSEDNAPFAGLHNQIVMKRALQIQTLSKSSGKTWILVNNTASIASDARHVIELQTKLKGATKRSLKHQFGEGRDCSVYTLDDVVSFPSTYGMVVSIPASAENGLSGTYEVVTSPLNLTHLHDRMCEALWCFKYINDNIAVLSSPPHLKIPLNNICSRSQSADVRSYFNKPTGDVRLILLLPNIKKALSDFNTVVHTKRVISRLTRTLLTSMKENTDSCKSCNYNNDTLDSATNELFNEYAVYRGDRSDPLQHPALLREFVDLKNKENGPQIDPVKFRRYMDRWECKNRSDALLETLESLQNNAIGYDMLVSMTEIAKTILHTYGMASTVELDIEYAVLKQFVGSLDTFIHYMQSSKHDDMTFRYCNIDEGEPTNTMTTQQAQSASASAPRAEPASAPQAEPASAPQAESTSAPQPPTQPALVPQAESTSAPQPPTQPASAPQAESTSAPQPPTQSAVVARLVLPSIKNKLVG